MPSRMKLRRWSGIVLNLTLAALVISGAVIYVVHFKSPALEIRDSVSGRVYGKWPLDESGEFALEFVHSVHQSPVRETFGIEGRTIHKPGLWIRPLSVRFFSFGAGMQSDLQEGQTLSRDGNALLISGFNTSYRELNYIVGTVSDHLLFISGETVSLRNLCGKNAHITLRIK